VSRVQKKIFLLIFIAVLAVGLISVLYLLRFTQDTRTRADTVTPTPSPVAVPQRLRWAPPTLSNPTTITLGTGATQTTLDTTKDYIINFPPTKKTGYTWLIGGRNIVIKSGYLTTPTGYTDTSQRRAIYIKNAVGTVHIEGILIDNSGGGEMDAVAISAPNATVQLQNIRVLDLHGSVNTEHSDLIQPWGGVKELRVDRFTGTTNYQGFYFVQTQTTGFMGTITIQNVNLSHQFNPLQNVPRILYMVDNNCGSHPTSISFTNTYFNPHASRSFAEETLPSTTQPSGCLASLSNGTIIWPRSTWVTGSVKQGVPPGGDFVPDGTVGTNYVSPGYESDPAPTPTGTSTPTVVVPTSTPAPTNTPVPNTTKFSVNVFLHGIGTSGDNANPSGGGNMTPVHPQRTVTLELFDGNNTLVKSMSGTVTFNPAVGSFTGIIDGGNSINNGNYIVKIRTQSYLRNQLNSIIPVSANQTTQLVPITLITGDASNDNALNLIDYNLILDCYAEFSPARNCDAVKKLATDLNDDGAVDLIDFNLFIRELSVQSGV
jgi:hypothetical protein